VTILKETDVFLGEIPFTDLLQVYGPEIGLAGIMEELTNAPDAPPGPASRAFLQKYLASLPANDAPSIG